MAPSSARTEEAVFQTIVPQLESEGFKVFTYPSRRMLPPFLRDHHPDAIALKGDRKIAIEVTSRSGPSAAKVGRLRDLLSAHSDWELRVVYAPPRSQEDVIPVASRATIEARLEQLERGSNASDGTGTLLIAWAVFEAAARFLVPQEFERPQMAGRLLEALASHGHITPDEADALRQLARLRNKIAHGQLDLKPARREIDELIRVTRTILSLHD